MKFIDLTGQTFGRLTVIGLDGPAKGGQLKWFCQCNCGSPVKSIRGVGLRLESTKSCGCLRSETTNALKTIHGKHGSSEYASWCKILRRCLVEKDPAYKSYGGRGIKVCERWLDFSNFYNDMGDKPSPKHTIDRIDVNGNYEKSNCRWATMKVQQRNRTNNVYITYLGKTDTLAAHCENYDVPYKTAHRRLTLGFPVNMVMSKNRLPRNSMKASERHHQDAV